MNRPKKLTYSQLNELERDKSKKDFKFCTSNRCHPSRCKRFDSCTL